jgi:hypothetical protein
MRERTSDNDDSGPEEATPEEAALEAAQTLISFTVTIQGTSVPQRTRVSVRQRQSTQHAQQRARQHAQQRARQQQQTQRSDGGGLITRAKARAAVSLLDASPSSVSRCAASLTIKDLSQASLAV